MKCRIVVYIIILFSIYSCKKENSYFVSNKIYDAVIHSVDDLDSKNECIYVFNFSDTLVITSVNGLNACIPCGGAMKEGYFLYNKKKIFLTKPINANPEIIKTDSLTKHNFMHMINTTIKINRNPNGIIFKVYSPNKLQKIFEGNVSKYLDKSDYKFPIKG